jgi:hypothetical protein
LRALRCCISCHGGGPGDGGDGGRSTCAHGFGVVVEKGLFDNPARIILAGIVLLPVDIVDVDPDFFLDLLAGAGRHAADFLDQVGQLLGVFGQPLGTDHQNANDQQKKELRAVDSKHFRKITLSGLQVTISTRGPGQLFVLGGEKGHDPVGSTLQPAHEGLPLCIRGGPDSGRDTFFSPGPHALQDGHGVVGLFRRQV